MSITYTAREQGGYYATTEDRRVWTLTQTDAYRRTSSHFKWTARRAGKVGWGATREEAVRAAAASN